MKIFSNISAINPRVMATWQRRLFLTFDIDWANDEVLADTIKIVRGAGIASTWFVTHNTPLLQEIRSLNGAELGIHPNFNPLLDGNAVASENTAWKVLDNALSIVPNARAIRSHSLTQSERLVELFRLSGLTHVSNSLVPHGCGFEPRPFHCWDKMVVVPHCWQDNVALKMPIPFPTEEELHSGFHVFNFHPIHVFLNTENEHRYERTRYMHQNPEELIKHRFEGIGTRSRLIALLKLAVSSSAIEINPGRSAL
jgi:hypothetical protein